MNIEIKILSSSSSVGIVTLEVKTCCIGRFDYGQHTLKLMLGASYLSTMVLGCVTIARAYRSPGYIWQLVLYIVYLDM